MSNSASQRSNLSSLCKDICVRCRNDNDDKWDKRDDTCWKQGYIFCHYEYIDETDMPPRQCPYQLEHMLEVQERTVQ